MSSVCSIILHHTFCAPWYIGLFADRLLDWFLGYLTTRYQLMMVFRFNVHDSKIYN